MLTVQESKDTSNITTLSFGSSYVYRVLTAVTAFSILNLWCKCIHWLIQTYVTHTQTHIQITGHRHLFFSHQTGLLPSAVYSAVIWGQNSQFDVGCSTRHGGGLRQCATCTRCPGQSALVLPQLAGQELVLLLSDLSQLLPRLLQLALLPQHLLLSRNDLRRMGTADRKCALRSS